MDRLHRALSIQRLGEIQAGDIVFQHVKLQHGRDNVVESLHGEIRSFSSSGIQAEHILLILGFEPSHCGFVSGQQCFAREVALGFQPDALREAIPAITAKLRQAERDFEACGIYLRREALLHGRHWSAFDYAPGDGHVGSEMQLSRSAEDDHLAYRLSTIQDGSQRGWVFHFGLKGNLPPEWRYAVEFLGLDQFSECPHFEFGPCYYKFTQLPDGDFFFAERVGNQFESLRTRFSTGVGALIEANSLATQVGMPFLRG